MSNLKASGIYMDLMREFVSHGHIIYWVTPVERQFHKSTNEESEGNLHLLHVKILNIQKTNLIEKGFSTISVEYFYRRAIEKYYPNVKFDLIMYSTPPITFSGLVNKLKKRDGAKTYLLLKDIFPQNAVDLGMFSKHSPFYWYFRKREIELYKGSDYIGCMSPANVEFVTKYNPFIPADRIELAPNSIKLSHLPAIDKEEIRRRYNLPVDLPIFIYGGNLGKPQGLDFLLKVLESNISKKDIFFLIVGNGTEYQKIASWFDIFKPQNARLMKGLPKKEYDILVRSCDVGLIFLDPRFTIPNYPSRLLSYLENRMPILAATDVNTDIGILAEKNGYGFWCKNGDTESFNALLAHYANAEKRREMGENGYQFLLDHYLVDHTYNSIVSHFN